MKGDSLPASYYIRELFGAHSVNTAPLATIEAYIATKETEIRLPMEDSDINGYFTRLADSGFDMDEVYDTLLSDGLKAFEEAFSEMLDSLK